MHRRTIIFSTIEGVNFYYASKIDAIAEIVVTKLGSNSGFEEYRAGIESIDILALERSTFYQEQLLNYSLPNHKAANRCICGRPLGNHTHQ